MPCGRRIFLLVYIYIYIYIYKGCTFFRTFVYSCFLVTLTPNCTLRIFSPSPLWEAQSAGAIEYTECISTEGYDPW